MARSIKLGQKVRDRFTGMEGIAVGRQSWLYGCERIIVQPPTLKDGVPVEMVYVDEPQLDVVEDTPAPKAEPRHGPTSTDPGRPTDTRR